MSSREEFEAWVVTHHIGASLDGDIWDDPDYPALWGEFIYEDWDVQNSWASWQASRQALEIDLPGKVSTENGYSEDDEFHNAAIDSCRRAIEAAGVRVKP